MFLTLILLGVGLYFGIQTYGFQTWLAKRASNYLSSELNNTVEVKAVKLEFFSKAQLKGVTILDRHLDTLLNGDLLVNIKKFSYRQKKINFGKITLKNVTSKLIRYKGDSTFNYQFLVDYFDSGKADTSTSQPWNVQFGDLILDNVSFVYRNEKYVTKVTRNINFDDIWLTHTSGKIAGFKIKGDTIQGTVSKLRTLEQSGFELINLSTTASISGRRLLCENLVLKTPITLIKGKIDFSSSSWDDYTDFIQKVQLNCRLEDSSYVHTDDIASFASELNGLKKTIFLSGEIKGYVSDMNLKGLKLAYGNHTRFNGNMTLSGLPDLSACCLHFDAKELSTNYSDLARIPAYPFSENKKINLPMELKRLGNISYKGKFDGSLDDFTAFGRFNTGLGKVEAQLSIRLGKKPDDITYSGKLTTTDFALGTLIGQNDLNGLTLKSEINGKGISIKNLKASFVGQILNVTYNGYNYKNISLNGQISDELFKGLLVSKDPNADFDFNGTVNFKNKLPEMDFISTINVLKLGALNLPINRDSGVISSQVFISINGDNIDNLSGQINFDNTIYKTASKTFKLSSFNIEMDQASFKKKIKLTTEYLDAGMSGNYELSNLKPAIQVLLYNYYPTFFKKPVKPKKFDEDLTFKIRVKKFNTIHELFLPLLMFSPKSTLDGSFNAIENKLNIQVSSSKASFGNLQVTELGVILNENKNTVLGEVSGKMLNLNDSTIIENFNVAATSVDKDSQFSIDWDNLKSPVSKGELKGQIFFDNSELSLAYEKLNITVQDSTWSLNAPNSLIIDKLGSILVNPVEVSNRNQVIRVGGTLSQKPGDSLLITTDHVLLGQFNPLLRLIKLKLDGSLQGNIKLSNANKNFVFLGNLHLKDLKINDNTVGELVVTTDYNSTEQYISLNGFTSLGIQDESGNQVKNISFKGNYYLDKRPETIDVDFEARPANLKLLNPFLVDILTIKSAFVNGEGKIHGTPDKVKIDGKLKLFNSEVKVDYTNVTYNITGDIEILPDQIRFTDLLMREKGTKSAPQGTVNGNIFHSNFSKIQLDYDITYRNMLVLNTTEKENKLYYGKMYGSGTVGIYGSANNLYMKIVDTTTKNSKFYLPLDGPAELADNDFIHFVKRDTSHIRKTIALSGFNLDMAINATPDAQTKIILDKTSGDILNVQGQGDLVLKVNTLGKFEMFGDYIITNGDYLFTLENVINKKFDIDAGSSISWSGNPTNAEIDVVTSYRQRASVAPLLNDTTGQYKGRFPVDCKLKITGKLFAPNIKFAIDFPNIDATARARIDNLLSDEAELNRQVFSFLLFRSFVTPQIYNANNSGGVTASNAAASTGSEMLSNRVSGFLNTYFGNLTGVSDLQLGLNYRPGNQSNNEALDLALSKQFLNNKITVDGNFGVNNNTTATTQAKNSSGLIGDVNIDYKLSTDGRYRLKAFNRSNDNTQITTTGGPFTQGVGVFYREEFETLNQLFKRYQAKLKKKNPSKK